jgi:glucose dehydrogenase
MNWSKYSPLDQITPGNFGTLKVAWTWRSPDHELLQTLPRYEEMPLTRTVSRARRWSFAA